MHLMMLAIDWKGVFVPTMSLLELVLRGTILYLLILVGFRLFRREGGTLSTADLLVVLLVADAAQNGMASQYRSIPEGAVLVATIMGWSYLLDWLGFRYPWIQRLLRPPPLLLIENGKLQRRNLRAEMISLAELDEHLRRQGVEDVAQVKRCYLEPDGGLSVLRLDSEGPTPRQPEKATPGS